MNKSTSEFSDSKLVFKVRLQSEIKKIVIHNDEINYNELLLMMQRIFADKIKTSDEFTVKYTDEENDLITLSNDSDVALALQNNQKPLKLTIFIKDEEGSKSEDGEEIKPVEVFRELANIRSSIDKFLDKFDKYLKLESNIHKLEDLAKKTAESAKLLEAASSSSVNNELHKEFDPLNRRAAGGSESGGNDLANRFQKNSRAQTPDSITEFSDGHKRVNGGVHQTKLPDSTTNSFPQQQQPQQQQHPLVNSVSSSSIQPSQSNVSLAEQHHHHQQHQAPQPQQQQQQHHQQQQHQAQFHPQFNGQSHHQQPPHQMQQQPQQQQPQQQQQQMPPQPPNNPYFANPIAMKPGVPGMPTPTASNIPQQQQQQQQHPALSPGQAPFLPPLGTANPQMTLQQQYLPPGGAADPSAHQFYQQQQQMPQQQNQFHQMPQQQQQQQQPNQALLQAQHQQQLNQQSPSNPVFPMMMNAPGSNPYSQKSAAAAGGLAATNRPPSATYQPGYK